MKSCFATVAALAVMATSAQAALTTAPSLFTDQAIASTGHFEWDEMSGSVTTPGGPASIAPPAPGTPGVFTVGAPDVADTGIGDAELSAEYRVLPFNGPPAPIVTSTLNIYSGGTLADYDLALTSLETTEAFTTVVLQLSILGDFVPGSILLDGAAPTTLVDRGIASDVQHGPAASEFDTQFYWAEWQVAADGDYLVEFATEDHQSLTQVRAEYFNTAAPFAAVAAAAVPEPSSVGLAAMVACGASIVGLRRRFDAKASRS